jgi:hypothetical protein
MSKRRNIAVSIDCLAAPLLYTRDYGAASIVIDVSDSHPSTVSCQPQRRSGADTACRASDDSDAIRQFHRFLKRVAATNERINRE